MIKRSLPGRARFEVLVMTSAVFHTRLYTKTALDFSNYHLMKREVAGCYLTATAHPPQFAIPWHAHWCFPFGMAVATRRDEGLVPLIAGTASADYTLDQNTWKQASE